MLALLFTFYYIMHKSVAKPALLLNGCFLLVLDEGFDKRDIWRSAPVEDLLTEIGITEIIITGGSGDQGIGGKGVVKLNDVVSLNIVFQCKRYRETVSPHHVRDFRGAMQGRGEKGLIITTGRFTKEAKAEASRDGVTPIELIDGNRLVELFEKYRLGLKPVTVFEIDHDFFKPFN